MKRKIALALSVIVPLIVLGALMLAVTGEVPTALAAGGIDYDVVIDKDQTSLGDVFTVTLYVTGTSATDFTISNTNPAPTYLDFVHESELDSRLEYITATDTVVWDSVVDDETKEVSFQFYVKKADADDKVVTNYAQHSGYPSDFKKDTITIVPYEPLFEFQKKIEPNEVSEGDLFTVTLTISPTEAWTQTGNFTVTDEDVFAHHVQFLTDTVTSTYGSAVYHGGKYNDRVLWSIPDLVSTTPRMTATFQVYVRDAPTKTKEWYNFAYVTLDPWWKTEIEGRPGSIGSLPGSIPGTVNRDSLPNNREKRGAWDSFTVKPYEPVFIFEKELSTDTVKLDDVFSVTLTISRTPSLTGTVSFTVTDPASVKSLHPTYFQVLTDTISASSGDTISEYEEIRWGDVVAPSSDVLTLTFDVAVVDTPYVEKTFYNIAYVELDAIPDYLEGKVGSLPGSLPGTIPGGDTSMRAAWDSLTLTPAFELVTNTVGQGSITLDPADDKYNNGTVVTLTADAADGWQFDSWSGDAFGTLTETTVTMNVNKVVTATFNEAGPMFEMTPASVVTNTPYAIQVYTLTLKNTSGTEDVFWFTDASTSTSALTPPDNLWNVVRPTSITIGAGLSATANITVEIPAEEVKWVTHTATITATSQNQGTALASELTTLTGGYWNGTAWVGCRYDLGGSGRVIMDDVREVFGFVGELDKPRYDYGHSGRVIMDDVRSAFAVVGELCSP